MRDYEIMCAFPSQQEEFEAGMKDVKSRLESLDTQFEKEEDMGARKLAYKIKKHTHAHFVYFVVKMSPEKAHQVRALLAFTKQLIRILVVHI